VLKVVKSKIIIERQLTEVKKFNILEPSGALFLCSKTIMKIEFIASLPPIQSAINLDGNGDGARIKLDIPRSEIEAVLKLQGLAGQSFKVVISDGKD
jgi:hypothetical protein